MRSGGYVTTCRHTSFFWKVNVSSRNTSHFLPQNRLAKPSSLTLTRPLLTICEPKGVVEPRLGEPPMPDEPAEGEGGVKEKEGE